MVRHEGAVDEDAVPGDAVGGRPQIGEGVGQLVVAVEGPLGDHQRDVALARGQRQRAVELVVDDPHPGQAAPNVARRVVESVVVVPLECRRVRDGRLRRGRRRRFGAGRARAGSRCPTPSVSVPGGSGRRRTSDGPWSGPPGWPSNWVRLWPPWRWTVSSPASGGSSWSKLTLVLRPAGRLIVGPGKVPAVGPHPRLRAGEDLHLRLADRDLDLAHRPAPSESAAGPGTGPRRPGRVPAPPVTGPDRPVRAQPGTTSESAPPPRAPRNARRFRRDSGGRSVVSAPVGAELRSTHASRGGSRR